jgi:magnesium transporter
MATAADLMTATVPQARADGTVADAMKLLQSRTWAEVGHLYVVDHALRLAGQVPIERLLAASPEIRLDALRGDPPLIVRAGDNAETVALLAVEQHDADVAVLDESSRFMGAIPIGRLLAILHEEHVDDILRMGGLAAFHPVPPETGGAAHIVRARVPWLLIGLLGGFLAGGVASLFEAPLRDNITLAFFLPLVVYMADAVGTQTETVLVRALAYGKVSLGTQLLREGTVGLIIGGIVGLSSGHTCPDHGDRDARRQPITDWTEPSRRRSRARERPGSHRCARYPQCRGLFGNRHDDPVSARGCLRG